MKPAFALFAGIFASGLALASFVEPTTHKIACRSFYTFAAPDSTVKQVEGPSLEDQNLDGEHRESVIDNKFGVKLSFDWNEASNFRDIHAKIEVRDDRQTIEASTYGKPSTVVHLPGLSMKVTEDQTLTAISLFCGFAPQF